jgi:Zn finger protein HypA/HybF involved in hydrogenase expression
MAQKMSEKVYEYFCREAKCEHMWMDVFKFRQDQTFCPKCGSWKITVRDR